MAKWAVGQMVCPDCCRINRGPCAPPPPPPPPDPDVDADPPLTAEQAEANAQAFSTLLGMPVSADEVMAYDADWRRLYGRSVARLADDFWG
jgi:hypothetical protein